MQKSSKLLKDRESQFIYLEFNSCSIDKFCPLPTLLTNPAATINFLFQSIEKSQ